MFSVSSCFASSSRYVRRSSRSPKLPCLAHIERPDPSNERFGSNIRFNRPSLIPKLVEPHITSHLRPHEAWMHNCYRNLPLLQIQTQQLRAHIQRRFTSMMPVVAAALRLMSKRYASAFRRDEYDLGLCVEERTVIVRECCDEDSRTDDTCSVHLLLGGKRGLLKRFGHEVAGCYDDDVKMRYARCLEVVDKIAAGVRGLEVDAGDVGDVVC
jgi:hypothetical protein